MSPACLTASVAVLLSLVTLPLEAACNATVTIDVTPPTLAPGDDFAVVTITHTFTGSATGTVALEGWQSWQVDDAETTIVHYPMSCKPTGTYMFRAIATPTGPGCNEATDRATAERSITVNGKPSLGISSVDFDGDSTLAVAVDWTFPIPALISGAARFSSMSTAIPPEGSITPRPNKAPVSSTCP